MSSSVHTGGGKYHEEEDEDEDEDNIPLVLLQKRRGQGTAGLTPDEVQESKTLEENHSKAMCGMDGFGSHVRVWEALQAFQDEKILQPKEEADSSQTNQAFDQARQHAPRH